MRTLRCDLHNHVSQDAVDKIRHTATQLINQAKNCGIDAIAITSVNLLVGIFFCSQKSTPSQPDAGRQKDRKTERPKDMKTNIKTLAEKAGLTLTSKGNIELGSDDQGSHGTPGSRASNSAVSYYLTPSGDVRAVIDNRYGSNQGYIEWHGGDVTRMDGSNLDEAIQLAREHVESLDDADLLRAWRIASSEARATMRKIKAADTTDTRSPLADVSTAELEAELSRRCAAKA
jgi:hypothetical protein